MDKEMDVKTTAKIEKSSESRGGESEMATGRTRPEIVRNNSRRAATEIGFDFRSWLEAQRRQLELEGKLPEDESEEQKLLDERKDLTEALKDLILEALKAGLKVRAYGERSENVAVEMILTTGQPFKLKFETDPTLDTIGNADLRLKLNMFARMIEHAKVWDAISKIQSRLNMAGVWLDFQTAERGPLFDNILSIEIPPTAWDEDYRLMEVDEYGTFHETTTREWPMTWGTYFYLLKQLERLEAGKMIGEISDDLKILQTSVRFQTDENGCDLVIFTKKNPAPHATSPFKFEKFYLGTEGLEEFVNHTKNKANALRS